MTEAPQATRLEIRPLHHRPGTQDELVWQQVMLENEYRLPDSFHTSDVVVDIGAHIGVFAVSCLAKGAGTVLCFEPDEANCDVLRKNLEEYPGGHIFQMAVWKPGEGKAEFTGYPELMTACGSVLPDVSVGGINERREVPCCSLDEILGVVEESGKRVRLLKLDCELAEYVVLYTSKKLHLADEIAMEAHELAQMPASAKVSGHDCSAAGLKRWLHSQGFATVELEWLRDHRGGSAFHLFATR